MAYPEGLDGDQQDRATGGRRTGDVRDALVSRGLLRTERVPPNANGGRPSIKVFAVPRAPEKPAQSETSPHHEVDPVTLVFSQLLEELDDAEETPIGGKELVVCEVSSQTIDESDEDCGDIISATDKPDKPDKPEQLDDHIVSSLEEGAEHEGRSSDERTKKYESIGAEDLAAYAETVLPQHPAREDDAATKAVVDHDEDAGDEILIADEIARDERDDLADDAERALPTPPGSEVEPLPPTCPLNTVGPDDRNDDVPERDIAEEAVPLDAARFGRTSYGSRVCRRCSTAARCYVALVDDGLAKEVCGACLRVSDAPFRCRCGPEERPIGATGVQLRCVDCHRVVS